MENAINIESLVVDRGKRRVLDRLTVSVPPGSITGLLGPSGSGKTTLMRSIIGVQKVRSGKVTVLGQEAGSTSLRRRVAFMTQTPSIYTDLTVIENARYFASLYRLDGSVAETAIRDVGLSDAADQLVGTLSGGQRARASLACALLPGPEVLILDEPTVGQDPVLRDELWRRFRGIAEGGATLLVSSHVMDEAAHCDRLLLLHEGAIIADDSPAGVLARTGTTSLDEAFLKLVLLRRPEAA